MVKISAAAVIVLLSITAGTFADFIPTIPVGNAGNPGNVVTIPDARWYMNGTFGHVPYDYRIGTTEVTNDQYVAFLNSVAATDTFTLFSSLMTIDSRGGIVRTGSSGNYSYSSKANMGNKPVNYTNFWDATRFANWLHNGMPSGLQDDTTTEDGTYSLNGDRFPPNMSVTRNPGAVWFIPSEDEWYKAAYHKNNGITGDYFNYPTAHNTRPTEATANSVGDVSNPGPNVANFRLRARWNGQYGNVTTVASAGSTSAYGTYDQGGNLDEFTETIVDTGWQDGVRVVRGGPWKHGAANLHAIGWPAGSRDLGGPDASLSIIGFRVATVAVVLTSADFDQDGDVDGTDFLAWQSGFGTLTAATKSDGDYDNDGDVDGDDFIGWQSEFNSGNGAASAAVPEPTSIGLWIVTFVGAIFLSRRR